MICRLCAKLLVVGLLFAASARAHAQAAIPEQTLQRLKAATVYVRVPQRGGVSSGSGFIMEKTARNGLIVTNAHVVAERGSPASRVECVFNSGTDGEYTTPAKVVGFDPDRDLAVLAVADNRLASPLNLKTKQKVRETLPVYVIGFPFGQSLAASRRGPAATISVGRVSSIRRDDLGNVAVVQIDSAINPGNSGGPVVDGAGALIGIAVAKVRGSQIGFAIPPHELSAMLLGRISRSSFTHVKTVRNRVEFDVVLTFIDPKNRIRSVGVEAMLSSQVPTPSRKTSIDSFAPMNSRSKKFSMSIKSGIARGKAYLEAVDGKATDYLVQICYVQGDGKKIYTEPGKLVANPELDKLAKSSRPGSRPLIAGYPHGRPPSRPPTRPETPATESLRARPIIPPLGASGLQPVRIEGQQQEIPLSGSFDSLEVVLPFNGMVKVVCMGSASQGPVLVHWAKGTEALDRGFYTLFDLKTLQPITWRLVQEKYLNILRVVPSGSSGQFPLHQGYSYRDQMQVRASAAGHVFSLWCTSHSPSGLGVLFIDGDAAMAIYKHESVGHIAPTVDGGAACSAKGYYSANLEQKRGDTWCLPTFHPGYYMVRPKPSPHGSRSGSQMVVSIFDASTGRPVHHFNVTEPVAEKGTPRNSFPVDKRYHCIPQAKCYISIPYSNDRLVVRPLDFDFAPLPQPSAPPTRTATVAAGTRTAPAPTTPGGSPTPEEGKKNLRIWTDATGSHRIEAEFVTYIAGKVKLRTMDGKVINIPLEKLSKKDAEYINALRRRKR